MKPPLLKLNRSSRPRGISLVEMVLSITLMAVALTLIGRVTLQLARLERTMNDQRQTDEAWRRLARDFRADTHAARSVIAISEDDHEDAAALRFTCDDEATADYRVTTAGVTRIARRGDRVVHREHYRLGERNWANIALKKPTEKNAALDHAVRWAEITRGDETDLGERRVQWRILAAITGEVARSSPRRSRLRQPRQPRSRYRRLRRRGAILAAALVALLIITMFSAVVIRRSYLARQQTRLAHHRLQASWVVESMVRRAILRAETKPMAETLQLVIPATPGEAVSGDNTLPRENGAGENAASETALREKATGDNGRVQLAGEREVWRVTIDWTKVQSEVPGEVPGASTTWDLQVTATLGDETRPIVVERRERRVKLGQNLPQPKEGNDES